MDGRRGQRCDRGGVLIAVVGAGISGLVCAYQVLRGGEQVMVFEAEEEPGGRVRTTVTPDGYRLDRGFQVLLSAYPALRRHAPLAALQPRYFSSGVDVAVSGRLVTLGHPLFAPIASLKSPFSGLVQARDLRALAKLLRPALGWGDAPLVSSMSTAKQALDDAGASGRFIEQVVSPLFGGIAFDRSLGFDASLLQFVLRSLAFGRTFVPAFGIQQLPNALAQRLPPSTVHVGTPVESILIEEGRAVGVRAAGVNHAADAVVVATDATNAAVLAGVSTPDGARSCTTAYVTSDRPLVPTRRLTLNSGGSLVNELAPLSNVAPEYVPRGRHLASMTALQVVPGDDGTVLQSMVNDLRCWLPGAEKASIEGLSVVRVPYAQFAQPPGIYARLPSCLTGTSGLFLGGEFLHSSSVQGAIRGGEWAAATALAYVRRSD